jgi:hypothetical protein
MLERGTHEQGIGPTDHDGADVEAIRSPTTSTRRRPGDLAGPPKAPPPREALGLSLSIRIGPGRG